MANKYNSNRLQFVHCDTLFATREEAKAYVEGQLISIDRPSLYAEPMIMKYGDAANPSILLAIGSVGDGVTRSTDNKVFYIDLTDVKESLEDIIDVIETTSDDVANLQYHVENIIKACGIADDGTYVANNVDIIKNATSLNDADVLLAKEVVKNTVSVVDTNSVNLTLDVKEEGSTLSADIILADAKVVETRVLPNIILSEDNGVFANVEVSYADDVITVGINGDMKTYQLPHEVHLESGVYNVKTESFDLTLTDGTVVSISASDLIDEWGVLDANAQDSPVVLAKTHVSHETDIHGNSQYRDILSADIRIASEEQEKYNILRRDATNNRYLYVDGTAKNITYFKDGIATNVQDAIDSIECEASSHKGNIVSVKEDGVFAEVEMSYDAARNVLIFDNGINGGKEIVLNSAQIIDNIYYDVTEREIVIVCSLTDGTKNEVRVKVDDVLTTFDVDNTNRTITLTSVNKDSKTYMSGDVNISNLKDNILVNDNNSLYVKGTADNIVYNEQDTVYSLLFKLDGTVDTIGSIRNLINMEKVERVATDDLLNATLNDEITARKEADNNFQTALANEIKRAENAEKANDNAIKGEVTARVNAVDMLNTRIAAVESNASKSLVASAKTLDTKIDTTKSELNQTINKVNSDLTASINAVDTKVATLEEKFDTEVTTKVQTLDTRITTEVATLTSEISRVNSVLETEISNTADAITADLTKREGDLKAMIELETANRQSNDTSLVKAIDDLDVRVAKNYQDNLAEVARIDAAEANIASHSNAIEVNIEDIAELKVEMKTKAHSFTTLETQTAKVTLENNVLSTDVKVAQTGLNIIQKGDDGLRVAVDVKYDKMTNTLTFSNGFGSQEWVLTTQSLVKDIDYNAKGELIMTVVLPDGTEKELKVNIDRLQGGSVEGSPIVTNVDTDEQTGARVVTATLNISDDDTNLISNNGALYASNRATEHYGVYRNNPIQNLQAILGIIAEDIDNVRQEPLEPRVTSLETRVLAIEEALRNLIDFGATTVDPQTPQE